MAKTLNEILINVIIFLNILDYEVRALPGKVGISSTVNTDRIQITRQNAKIYCSCPESKKFLKLSPFWLSAANSCQPDSSWFQNSWVLDLKTLCLWAIKTWNIKNYHDENHCVGFGGNWTAEPWIQNPGLKKLDYV